MQSSNTLLRSITAVLSGQVLIRILGVLFTPILVRLLTREEFGTYAVFLAIFTISAVVAKGGLFSSVRKHVAEYHSDADEQSRLVVTGLGLSIIYATIVSFLAVILSALPAIELQFSIVLLLVVTLFVRNPYEIFRSAFYGRQQESVSEKLDVIRKLVYIIIALILAWLGYGVFGVFIGYTAAYLIIAPLATWLAFRHFQVDEYLSIGDFKSHSWRILRFGGVEMIGALAAMLLYRTDILLIEYFRSPTETAIYQAALIPAELVWFIPSAIQAALLQDIASSWADEKIEAINQTLHSSLKYAVLSLLLLGIGLFGLAEEFLIVYYGPGYTEGATALRILLIGTFFFGVNRIYVPLLQATGWLKYNTIITVLALVLNIVLNVVLIPKYGIEGAAIGTGISYMSVFFGSIIILYFTDFSPFQPQMAIQLLLTGGLFASLYLTIIEVVSLGVLQSLIVFPVIGGFLFISAAIVTKTVDVGTIRDLYRENNDAP